MLVAAVEPLVSADPVTINFTATTTTSVGTLDSGTALSGSFTYDDTTPGDTNFLGGTVYYTNPISSASINGETVDSPYANFQLYNDNPNYDGDLVSVLINYPSTDTLYDLGGLTGLALEFLIGDTNPSPDLINGQDADQLENLNLGDATQRQLQIYYGASGGNQGYVAGEAVLDSWVAAPDTGSTFLLLGVGLAALFFTAARRGARPLRIQS
jgi:hypothetical protein